MVSVIVPTFLFVCVSVYIGAAIVHECICVKFCV